MTPSPPVPLEGERLLSFLTLLELARRRDTHAVRIGTRPLPSCPTCQNRPRDVDIAPSEVIRDNAVFSTSTEMLSLSPRILTLEPCGHQFAIADEDLVRGMEYARNAVQATEERTAAPVVGSARIQLTTEVLEPAPAPTATSPAPRRRTVTIGWADLLRGLLHRQVTLTVTEPKDAA